MTPGRAIAVIPARGGSKRVPDKNVRHLAGKPLIAYTIAAAVESGIFSRVVVSTDSQKIAEVARQCGAEVPFMREATLADDFSHVSAGTADALARLDPQGREYEAVSQLMPSCPFRTADDIIASHDQFAKSCVDSQISVVRYVFQNPWWAVRLNARRELQPVFKEHLTARSQDLPELFCPAGGTWWARTEPFRRVKNFYQEGVTAWEIPWQRGFDIDTLEDWAMAEVISRLLHERTFV